MNKKTKRLAFFGLMVALAFVFSYLESLIPFNFGIPGIKLGLANLVVVVAIYTVPKKDAFFIAIIRIVLAGFTFGGVTTMLYSLAGGILSFAVMAVMQKNDYFSVIGVSMAGGVAHNAGQMIVAGLVMNTARIIYYFPVLIFVGVITGVLIGVVSNVLINRLNKVIKS